MAGELCDSFLRRYRTLPIWWVVKFFIVAAITFATLYTFSGCSSLPSSHAPPGYTLLPDDHSIYIRMPIEENRSLVQELLQPLALPDKLEETVLGSRELWGGISLGAEEREMTILLDGRSSTFLVSAGLDANREWERVNDQLSWMGARGELISIPYRGGLLYQTGRNYHDSTSPTRGLDDQNGSRLLDGGITIYFPGSTVLSSVIPKFLLSRLSWWRIWLSPTPEGYAVEVHLRYLIDSDALKGVLASLRLLGLSSRVVGKRSPPTIGLLSAVVGTIFDGKVAIVEDRVVLSGLELSEEKIVSLLNEVILK